MPANQHVHVCRTLVNELNNRAFVHVDIGITECSVAMVGPNSTCTMELTRKELLALEEAVRVAVGHLEGEERMPPSVPVIDSGTFD